MPDDTLAQVLDWIRSHHFGKHRGVVAQGGTADPTHRGRLKVRVPAVLGDLEVWAMPCVPYAGDKVGFYCLPEEGAGLWVEFEGGDPSYPIWTGCFWADDELPAEAEKKPDRKVWRSAKLLVRLNDGGAELTAQNVPEGDGGAKTVLTLTDKALTVENNESKLTVDKSKVRAETSGASAEVAGSFSANDGALEVT